MNNIEIQLPEGKEGRIACSKVGSMQNGEFLLEKEYEASKVDLNSLHSAAELRGAAQTLISYEKSGAIYEIDEDGRVLMKDLENGVYLIHGYDAEELGMIPTLVFVPTWMETEGVMLHDITVIPKIEERLPMGDQSANGIGLLFLLSFFAIFFVLFRRKHLFRQKHLRKGKNCDTMQ